MQAYFRLVTDDAEDGSRARSGIRRSFALHSNAPLRAINRSAAICATRLQRRDGSGMLRRTFIMKGGYDPPCFPLRTGSPGPQAAGPVLTTIDPDLSRSRFMRTRKKIETTLEFVLFNSRWLLAPFYAGLVVSLVMLLVAFIGELVHVIPGLLHASPEEIILAVLALIDLSLAGNLVVIVMFSGYENFVSRIDTSEHEYRPNWMGTLDFSGLKMKLIGSIVAISAISLLRAFMSLTEKGVPLDEPRIRWLVILHLTFIVSGVLFAAMDWIADRASHH
jgi:uncharacterized protein (TIGR00645 family)